jgi:hypothetical protein
MLHSRHVIVEAVLWGIDEKEKKQEQRLKNND